MLWQKEEAGRGKRRRVEEEKDENQVKERDEGEEKEEGAKW